MGHCATYTLLFSETFGKTLSHFRIFRKTTRSFRKFRKNRVLFRKFRKKPLSFPNLSEKASLISDACPFKCIPITKSQISKGLFRTRPCGRSSRQEGATEPDAAARVRWPIAQSRREQPAVRRAAPAATAYHGTGGSTIQLSGILRGIK
jgi:hypothetical protein